VKKHKDHDPSQHSHRSREPFFARFLETQELAQAQGAKPDQTLKFPSDRDEI
jgi:hypothetical protein